MRLRLINMRTTRSECLRLRLECRSDGTNGEAWGLGGGLTWVICGEKNEEDNIYSSLAKAPWHGLCGLKKKHHYCGKILMVSTLQHCAFLFLCTHKILTALTPRDVCSLPEDNARATNIIL